MTALLPLFIFASLLPSSAIAESEGYALAHAPVDAAFSCTEHFAGQFDRVGDALGTDCLVTRLVEVNGRLFSRTYVGDGFNNEYLVGCILSFLPPCDCVVVDVRINPITNEPGKVGKPPASSLTFRRNDGVHFLYAHIQDPIVRVGDRVAAGQAVAHIGNNGYGRVPHVHVAAWQGEGPLQIRWDQKSMKLPPEFRK